MDKRQSVWDFLGRGIAWGSLFAVMTAPIYLGLFLLVSNILAVSHGLRFTLVMYTLHDVWTVAYDYTFRIFAIPCILGGGILGMVLYGLVWKGHRAGRLGLWIGVAMGGAVALAHLLFRADWLGRTQWRFDTVVYIMVIAAFGWLGWHLSQRCQAPDASNRVLTTAHDRIQ